MREIGLKKEGTLPMKVSKEIVGHLSVGLYRNFARAIKEVISNSYDAGATEVKIKLDIDNGKVIIRDNGRGMNFEEVKKLLSIGYPTPLTEEVDELGRKRIGTFGIGFLSTFPYCKKLQIITKKRNTNEIIELTINTERFFREGTFFLEDVEIPYKIYESDLPTEKGETIIILEDIENHIINELKQKPIGRSSIDKLGGYQKFKWTLCQYAPIQFPPNRKDLRELFSDAERIPMRLWLDGKELFRNVPEEAKILEKGEEKFGKVKIKYAIMTPFKPIEPREARGLQIRLRDVGIGLPTDFDVLKLKKILGKISYFCGEIHILSGLESALMIDRDSFSYTQEVSEIEEFFRVKLVKWNEQLERWALSDKEIYESLQGVKEPEKIIKELKRANIIHLSKERLRIPKKSTITRKKVKKLSSSSEKIKDALIKKEDYKIITEKGKAPPKESPIKVIPEEKTIVIYEEHPDFIEEIKIAGNRFRVTYGEWDPKETIYSICKLEQQNRVVFNRKHPFFKINFSEEVIKKLSLGIVLITKNRKDREELVSKLNHLLEEIFLGE